MFATNFFIIWKIAYGIPTFYKMTTEWTSDNKNRTHIAPPFQKFVRFFHSYS